MAIPILDPALAESDEALAEAQRYHQSTKATRISAARLRARARACGEAALAELLARSWKRYDACERLALPDVEPSPVALADLLVPAAPRRPVTLGELGAVLRGLGAAPVPAGTRAAELYPVVLDIPELAAGLYHYAPDEHALELLGAGGHGERARAALADPAAAAGAAALVVVTAVFTRALSVKLFRGYRDACVEVGALLRTLELVAAARGLGGCPFGSFLDDELDALVGADGVEESAMAVFALGVAPAPLRGF